MIEFPEQPGDEKGNTWVWCYVCHRCYTPDDAVADEDEHEKYCAYFPECDGLMRRDGWAWSTILSTFRRIETQLPQVPERGVAYLDTLFPRRLHT